MYPWQYDDEQCASLIGESLVHLLCVSISYVGSNFPRSMTLRKLIISYNSYTLRHVYHESKLCPILSSFSAECVGLAIEAESETLQRACE